MSQPASITSLSSLVFKPTQDVRLHTSGNAFLDAGIRLILCDTWRLREWTYANLSAPFWRFYWNEDPGARVMVTGQTVPLHPSRFVAIPPNTAYASQLRRPARHFALHFQAAPPYDRLAPEIFAFPATPHLLDVVREAQTLLRKSPPPMLRLSLLCGLLAQHALCQLPPDRLIPPRLDARVETAKRLMAENLAESLSNAHLARRVSLNRNAFIRVFHEITGQTPHAYLASLRVDRACVLLITSELSIDEIAAATGFCDRFYFSRAFKKFRGTTPAYFRQTMRRSGSGKR